MQHCCSTMATYLPGGYCEYESSLRYIPNIRTYIILNKLKKYKGYETIDYCGFCGTRLPMKLDKKMTEILQREYGLNSWRDYRRAPAKYHTDAWWNPTGITSPFKPPIIK